jgi:hypothetical protein
MLTFTTICDHLHHIHSVPATALFPPFSTSSLKHAQSAARNSREYAIPRTAHIYRTPEPNPSEGHDYRDISHPSRYLPPLCAAHHLRFGLIAAACFCVLGCSECHCFGVLDLWPYHLATLLISLSILRVTLALC